jgi:glycosyltransferase involved in cell wall biosynthesis
MAAFQPATTGTDEPSAKPFVTVLFPCLNEEDAVEESIVRARQGLADAGLQGEILISDNGSTDRSVEIALANGARVIEASPQGYGAAYLCGIEAAKGEIIVMADTDLTYPLDRIGDFVKACETAEMTMGIRQVHSDNMPTMHRLLGNPAITGLGRVFHSSEVEDFLCGMRAIRKDAAEKLDLKTPGMEFAAEMVILAEQEGFTIVQFPIDYADRVGESKLNRWRDGWRYLKFLLAHAPNRVFLYPGSVMALVGLVGMMALVGGPLSVGGRPWFVHTQVLFVGLWLVGLQMLALGWLSRSLERVSKREPDGHWRRMIEASMERALMIGGGLMLAGALLASITTIAWGAGGWADLQNGNGFVAGIGLLIGGLQLVAAAWFRAMVDVSVVTEPIEFHEVNRSSRPAYPRAA